MNGICFKIRKITFRIFLNISFCFSFIFSSSEGCSSSATIPDSLQKYIEIALNNNPSVRQRYYEYQAALQKVPQAGTLPDPELTMGIFLKPMELVSGRQAADLKLMQMFPWFGVLKNARDEMSFMAKAKYEQLRDSKLQAAFDVQSIWYELHKIRKEIAINESNLDILKVIEKLTMVKYSAPPSSATGSSSPGTMTGKTADNPSRSDASSGMQGMEGSQSNTSKAAPLPETGSMTGGAMGSSGQTPGLADIYSIRIEMGDLENRTELLKSRLITRKARLNNLLNRPVAAEVFTEDTLKPDCIHLLFESLPDSVEERNPMLSMSLFERQSYESRIKMATAMGYPMIGLGIDYALINSSEMSSSPMNGKDMIMPMVSVTLPVYRKKYNAIRSEAEFMKEAASENYQAASNALQTEYIDAVQQYKDAARRIRLYDDQAELAVKSLNLTIAEYSVASTDLANLLRARQQAQEYEIRKTEAVADLYISAARLNKLAAYGQ